MAWSWRHKLLIAGISGEKKIELPNTGAPRSYKCGKFDRSVSFAQDGGAPQTVQVEATIRDAWTYIIEKSAPSSACNTCFKKLPGKLRLTELLDGGDIVAACLVPGDGRTDNDVPRGWNDGKRLIAFGLVEVIRGAADKTSLAATMLHELAHLAGASTNARAARDEAIQAESVLKDCLLGQHFDPDALGTVFRRSRALYG
jgi:hypothetical protein